MATGECAGFSNEVFTSTYNSSLSIYGQLHRTETEMG